jgi:hypothetical protein
LDVSRLSPADCATAFRSFARRYRALFAGFDDDESAEALLNRPGAGGRSAAQLAARGGDELAAADEALRQTLVADEPAVTLSPAGGAAAGAATPQQALARVTGAAERLADRIDGTDAGDWARRAVLDGEPVTSLDLVRRAVRTASDGYRATERAVDEARRSLP